LEQFWAGRKTRISRLFTIKKRTYKVCFDFGTEFDLPDPYAISCTAGLLEKLCEPANHGFEFNQAYGEQSSTESLAPEWHG
jgi:hypothetical protein